MSTSENITIDELKGIVRSRLRDAGCLTTEVTIQEIVDPAVPYNWDVSLVNSGGDDPDAVGIALNRIIPELQGEYRVT